MSTATEPPAHNPAELWYYALVLAKDAGDEPAYTRLRDLTPEQVDAAFGEPGAGRRFAEDATGHQHKGKGDGGGQFAPKGGEGEGKEKGKHAPEGDGFAITQAAIEGTSDPVAKDFLESALFNATEGDERDLAQQLASAWAHAHDNGHGAATDALGRVLERVGAAFDGPQPGEPVAHSGKLYYAPPGIGSGDHVTVTRRPVVLGDGKVLVKGQVKPVGGAGFGADFDEDAHPRKGGKFAKKGDTGSGTDRDPAEAHEAADAVSAEVADEAPEADAAPGLREKVAHLARKAAVAVYDALPPPWTHVLAGVGTILDAFFDVPSDLAKLGYNPGTSSGTAGPRVLDSVKDATGISGHLAISIASKVIVKALFALKGAVKGKPKEMAADSGGPGAPGAAADWLADLFDSANAAVGLPKVDRAAVKAAVERLTAPKPADPPPAN